MLRWLEQGLEALSTAGRRGAGQSLEATGIRSITRIVFPGSCPNKKKKDDIIHVLTLMEEGAEGGNWKYTSAKRPLLDCLEDKKKKAPSPFTRLGP